MELSMTLRFPQPPRPLLYAFITALFLSDLVAGQLRTMLNIHVIGDKHKKNVH